MEARLRRGWPERAGKSGLADAGLVAGGGRTGRKIRGRWPGILPAQGGNPAAAGSVGRGRVSAGARRQSGAASRRREDRELEEAAGLRLGKKRRGFGAPFDEEAGEMGLLTRRRGGREKASGMGCCRCKEEGGRRVCRGEEGRPSGSRSRLGREEGEREMGRRPSAGTPRGASDGGRRLWWKRRKGEACVCYGRGGGEKKKEAREWRLGHG